jgi:hypothetical protein
MLSVGVRRSLQLWSRGSPVWSASSCTSDTSSRSVHQSSDASNHQMTSSQRTPPTSIYIFLTAEAVRTQQTCLKSETILTKMVLDFCNSLRVALGGPTACNSTRRCDKANKTCRRCGTACSRYVAGTDTIDAGTWPRGSRFGHATGHGP